jgi:FlaA1/EpsC-like NDP-sugar epimerase
LAFELRFDFHVPRGQYDLPFWLTVLLVARLAAFQASGLFRGLWRYTGAGDALAILKATTVSSLVLAAVVVSGAWRFPRSVVAIEWLVAVVLVGGLRFAGRAFHLLHHRNGSTNGKLVRVLIAGAGDGGEALAREILETHRGRYEPVCFVDDDPRKRGAEIHGVPVLGSIDELPRLVAQKRVEEVVIAIPTASGSEMRRIVDRCKSSGVRFKTVPSVDQIIDGRVRISQIRNVDIEDLLRRDVVNLDITEIEAAHSGRVILVTGAAGSIGSEMCRQACTVAPSQLVLVERAESALFAIHRELTARFPFVPIVPYLADVTDETRMVEIFRRHRPAVVYHVAAHKHVPMLEANPSEAIKNNVFGTKTLADVAHEAGVGRFVMISTDKAVNPTSVMGVSKRVAEIYVQALAQVSRTKFVTVRFGNVLGSNGSVVPIFREQIAAGGPVTVTHPDMKRYFMTIPEASQLVLQAGAMGKGGEIFVLDMGEPVRVVDLARDLITLSGLKPGEDIEIRFTGVRPGEKLFEELSVAAENCDRTRHPKIFIGRGRSCNLGRIEAQLEALARVKDGRPDQIRGSFADVVAEYRPDGAIDTPPAPYPAVAGPISVPATALAASK